MKPISLTIKGLNSFIQAQEIDFEKLTKQGLFGIFGPTGSGKSTILDGITLALYGEISRKSVNFINTNCEFANVSYEFQISGQENIRYRVEREFIKNKKSDGFRTRSAKIVEISGDDEIVLEDKVKSVTSKCEEIIGLKLDDFTRTVVLPQGKFSEFLKLTGKERSEMLERLFNLQKYGDDLSGKLMVKIRSTRSSENRLLGELSGYDDCSHEILLEKQKELEEFRKEFENCQKEVSQAAEKFKDGESLWNLQLELNVEKEKEANLKKDDDRIDKIQNMVLLAESALKVKPYIDPYEDTLENLNTSKKKLYDLKEKILVITETKKTTETAYEAAKLRKDNELPDLRLNEHKVNEAIEEKKVLDKLLEEILNLENNILNLKKKIESADAAVASNDIAIKDINEEISLKESKAEELIISTDFKDKINKALIVLNSFRNHEKHHGELLDNLGQKTDLLAKKKQDKINKSEALTLKNKEIEETTSTLDDLILHCPGDQDAILKLSEKLSDIKNKWKKNADFTSAIEKAKTSIISLENEVADKIIIRDKHQNDIDAINEKLKKIERENFAHTLREALSDSETCPVCGSKDHHFENVPDIGVGNENLDEINSTLKEKEKIHQNLSGEILTTQAEIKQKNGIIKENEEMLLELGEDYKAFSPEKLKEEFEALSSAVKKFNLDKEELNKKLITLTQEKNNLDTDYKVTKNSINDLETQLIDLNKNLQTTFLEFENSKTELENLKAELSVEDFNDESAKITQMEKDKASLESKIKDLRLKLKTSQTNRDQAFKELSSYKENLSGFNNLLTEKSRAADERRKSIISKAGEIENLEELKASISKIIKEIEDRYSFTEKEKNEALEAFDSCKLAISKEENVLNGLSDRLVKDKSNLEKALEDEGINDIREARNHLMSKDEIHKLKDEIDIHKDSLNRIAGSIDSLVKKIDGRSLTKEEWDSIISLKDEKTELLDKLNKSMIQLNENINTLSQRLESKKELLKKKDELDHTLSLLSDLEKLFKGKKFVDFVATNQLKYVSLEACKKLKEITAGNYGLEADENGRFMIRDYKNGGVLRDATTLSGGETFLASLALALALSAQIQLKGTSPLELFFLDEGFGTLDENLLETVMDSLEKVHHERLSIGIISHLDTIKNRIPIKLIVSPAVAGMGGSKVRIEMD